MEKQALLAAKNTALGSQRWTRPWRAQFGGTVPGCIDIGFGCPFSDRPACRMQKPTHTVRRCPARQREIRPNPLRTHRSRTSLPPSRRVNRSKPGCSGPQRAFLAWTWNATAACPDSRWRRPPKAYHPGLVAPAVHQPTPDRESATNMPLTIGVAYRRPSGLVGHGICRFSGWVDSYAMLQEPDLVIQWSQSGGSGRRIGHRSWLLHRHDVAPLGRGASARAIAASKELLLRTPQLLSDRKAGLDVDTV